VLEQVQQQTCRLILEPYPGPVFCQVGRYGVEFEDAEPQHVTVLLGLTGQYRVQMWADGDYNTSSPTFPPGRPVEVFP